MSKENNGGAAFPVNAANLGTAGAYPPDPGMSLRDYFAAKVIAPVLAGATLPTKEDRAKWLPIIAELAYEMADAMLAARDK